MPTSLNVGTRWYKCDLHLHTPASLCFKDRTVTPEMWVEAALAADLTCVAVTDHNTGLWIDDIKAAAEGKLVVFPGVEITCSDAKVHLLVLFDRDKGRQHVEDFLISTGIERDDFSKDTAHTNMSLEDTVEMAHNKGGLIIPAHIDEFNGLCEPGLAIVKRFLRLKNVLGVQIVHNRFLNDEKVYIANRQDFIVELNRYYNWPEARIAVHDYKYTDERMKNSRNAVKEAMALKKAILTFSDNPHQPRDPNHGLWGIGKRYTWIKMDGTPTLESLRQSLLMHGVRTRNDFDIAAGSQPKQYPELWFKRITIKDTELSDPKNSELSVEFNPQMNTIIGGRGSGKSSLLQFIRGIFDRGKDLVELDTINTEFRQFFKPRDRRSRKSGVLRPGCALEVDLVRNGTLFKVKFTQNTIDAKNSTTELLKFDRVRKEFIPDDVSTIPFMFEFDLFSQKQIYEIALSPNSLRSRIDDADDTVRNAVEKLEQLKQQYIQQSAAIRSLESQMQGRTKLEVEIRDLEGKIDLYRQSPLGELVKQFETLTSQKNILDTYISSLRINVSNFESLSTDLVAPVLAIDSSIEEDKVFFRTVSEQAADQLSEVAQRVDSIRTDYEAIAEDVEARIRQSEWMSRFTKLESQLNDERQVLKDAGLDSYGVEIDVEKLSTLKREQSRLDGLNKTKEVTLNAREAIHRQYVALRLEITQLRQTYLGNILRDGTVKVEVKQCADVESMESQLRAIIGADAGFDKDFEALVDRWNPASPALSNSGLRETFHELIADQEKTEDFGKRFVNKLAELNGESLDELDLFFPEDDIRISYGKRGKSIPLSNASAGQKTAAILTILLSQGEKPLLMDQPEDDLDNGLISDLVVNRLHEAKQHRQIIVVTHNPNIPVNGDSEYIIVMDAEKKHLTVKTAGCIEQHEVKDEICRIMEGGLDAFAMRAERYQFS